MRAPLRSLLSAAALALFCALVPVAGADDAVRLPLKTIDVVGRVVGAGALGVEGVRVSLEGVPEASAETDADGRYTLAVPIERLGDPSRRNVTARVTAHLEGWAFTLRNGQGGLAIELRMQTRTDPARCRVKSNLLAPVDVVAAAIARGDRHAVVSSIDFVGEEGAPPTSRMSLRSEAVTVVGEAAAMPAPAVPAGPVAARPEPDADRPPKKPITPEALEDLPVVAMTARPIAPSTVERRDAVAPPRERPSSRPRIRRIAAQRTAPDTAPAPRESGSIKLPGPGVTQNDASLIRRIETGPGAADLPRPMLSAEEVLAQGGDCACRIRGTIELHPDHLLSRRLDLVVTLRESPAVRDTIQLFMGSPRAFELPPVRCGTWYIEVDAVARRDFRIVSADGRDPIDCREGGLRQLRVVLEPS